MRTVTSLTPERRDRVRVELDGEAWRTLPATSIVAAGLRVGLPLDRERARELARSLRRVEALDVAGKALSRRDRTVAELDARLEHRGVRPAERAAAVETLERLGYLDDGRVAADRALHLAGRGFGDKAIRYDLEGRGIEAELIAAAIEQLEPETVRARTIVERSTSELKAARALAAKGFAPETIETALPSLSELEP